MEGGSAQDGWQPGVMTGATVRRAEAGVGTTAVCPSAATLRVCQKAKPGQAENDNQRNSPTNKVKSAGGREFSMFDVRYSNNE